MPWDLNDYPRSFKNFDPLLRKKAIDIANALIEEGYPESHAIPIATAEAERWERDASTNKKEDFAKQPNPQKNSPHRKERVNTELWNSDVMVYFEDNKWYVETKGAEHPAGSFSTQQEAMARAQKIAHYKNSKVVTYNKNNPPNNNK
ncbi:DUF2188 domain-containing protein [Melissococcus plutonius]|uniref:DUF2188 domain-containing protein n=2 Tax=Melissococcus plutonius TaxID=33970 RepID=F3YCB9_MELPT|nr:DUF2188 domain-containing protein [Melissococcus plutonius]BAL61620.1 hypothetical protein MPD5_0340 [Melissococcus plutonius DAT561]AIM25987.1 hypothetical protein MEPL_c015760 [Melissococcus plutonius S1]KMT24075.1 hypothetical protein MEPL2_3c02980 [Melissococcus plutonius]KMT24228.1 hypothetical protein MEPL3_7c01070 [Melissococcus plutonius]KMT25573.1 hypothetical protein MEPL1_7c01070 [Melissococcus plutonius]